MSRNIRRSRRSSLTVSIGWLFADLLLAVAMLFLIANTIAPARPADLTVTPTPTPTPTPTSLVNILLLDKERFRLKLEGIAPDKVSAGDEGAVQDLEKKVREQIINQGLQNRRAGIAIAFGGTDDNSSLQINQGVKIAKEVYKILEALGKQKFVFCKTVYYDPLFTLEQDSNTVLIDVYMFNRAAPNCAVVS